MSSDSSQRKSYLHDPMPHARCFKGRVTNKVIKEIGVLCAFTVIQVGAKQRVLFTSDRLTQLCAKSWCYLTWSYLAYIHMHRDPLAQGNESLGESLLGFTVLLRYILTTVNPIYALKSMVQHWKGRVILFSYIDGHHMDGVQISGIKCNINCDKS